MALKVITVASQKGGVGKSNCAIHMAAEAVRKGRKAVIIELDGQGTASQVWRAARDRLVNEDDLLRKVDRQRLPPEVVSIHSVQLEKALERYRASGYDYAVIDLPGTDSPGVNHAVNAADLVLVPSRPNATDLASSGKTVGAIHRLNRPYAYVLTFLQRSGKQTEEAREALEEHGHAVAPGGISDLKDYEDAIGTGKTVYEVKSDGKAAREIKALWKWLAKQLEVEDAKKVA
jgi:chromosome partitioning protein